MTRREWAERRNGGGKTGGKGGSGAGGKKGAHSAILRLIDSAAPPPPPPPPHDTDEAEDWLPLNDDGNAQRLLKLHRHNLMFVPELGVATWNGKHWDFRAGAQRAKLLAIDASRELRKEARRMADSRGEDDEFAEKFAKWATRSGDSGRLKSMLDLALTELITPIDELDADKFALNCQNGLVKFSDGEIRLLPHRPQDLCTRIANVDYDPDAKCPKWLKFLSEVIPDDQQRASIQRWLGYSMTGDTSQEKAAIFYGGGRNGKSTLVNAVRRLLGTYAARCSINTFLYQENRGGSGPEPDVIRLRGIRMALPGEPNQGARFDTGRIKDWTGNDAQPARGMFDKEFLELNFIFKLTFNTNPLPVFVETDDAIKNRLLLFGFTQKFKARAEDRGGKTLVEDLLTEASGILNWLLDGYSDYLEMGLAPSEAVVADTERYFSNLDPFQAFIETCCEFPPEGCGEEIADMYRVRGSKLYDAYKEWYGEDEAEDKKKASSSSRFGRWLNAHGYPWRRGRQFGDGGKYKWRIGLRLKSAD